MFIYYSPVVDTAYNLALEEFLLHNRTDDDYLVFWQSPNSIVVGRHQNTVEEINARFVEDHSIAVVRRSSGGGAVYQDTGNLNFSFITSAEGASRITMERFTRPVVAALSSLGVKAEASGRNDIIVKNKKISGNAQVLYGKRLLHHGTLLFNANLGILADALTVRPEKFRSKSAKSVRSRVGNICEFLPHPMNIAEFSTKMALTLTKSQPTQTLVLTSDEQQAITTIKQNKYDTWEWNYGKSPAYNVSSMEKYDGGFLEIYLDIHKGTIHGCSLYGDFMALRPVEEIVPLLIGIRYEKEYVSQALAAIPLAEYFGSITHQEILQCFFLTVSNNT